MKAGSFITFSGLLAACGHQQTQQEQSSVAYRDTVIISLERIEGLSIEHYTRYDSLGQIEFETAQVSAYDSIQQYGFATNDDVSDVQRRIAYALNTQTSTKGDSSTFTWSVVGEPARSDPYTITVDMDFVRYGPLEEAVLQIGPYNVWVLSTTRDTLQQLMSVMDAGHYLCFSDTTPVRDAYIMERRTEGYGMYQNAGFLIVPSRRDTVNLWSLVDRGLHKPAVWDWNGLVPMTLEEYQIKLKQMADLADGLAGLETIDSMMRAQASWVEVRRLTR